MIDELMQTYKVEEDEGGVFRIASSTLRYVWRKAEPDHIGITFNGKKRVLQQAWLGVDGSIDWRDIPEVEEP